MLPVSSAFLACVGTSHTRVTRADLWYGGRLVSADLPVIGGSVTLDDDAQIRATVEGLTIGDPRGDLVPTFAGDTGALNVYGHQLHLRSGVRYATGAEELVSLGWFIIQGNTIDESYTRNEFGVWASGGAVHSLTLTDRMLAIADSRFLAPEQPPPGAKCLSEIRRLCRGLVPFASWPTITDPSVPSTVAYQESRLDAVASLAAAAGVRAYMNGQGALAIRVIADPATLPVAATLSSATTITKHGRGFTRDEAYNAVVARGEQVADTAPLQAIAYDTDPKSPTRWDGPYGRKPAYYSSPLLTTTAQAQAAALNILRGIIRGRDQLVTVQAVPNPALEPGDVVSAVTPRGTFTGVLTLMKLPIDADGGAAEYTLRVAASGTVQLLPGGTVAEGVDL